MVSNICGNFIENKLINAQKGMATWIINVTELKFEAWCDLQGQLEVTMASEATNMAVRANMQMDFRVIEVADHNSDTKFDLRGY